MSHVRDILFDQLSSKLAIESYLEGVSDWHNLSTDLERSDAFAVVHKGMTLLNKEPALELASIRLDHKVFQVEFSPKGSRFLTSGNNSSITIWDSRTGMVLKEIQGRFSRSTFIDEDLVIAVGDELALISLEAETPRKVLNKEKGARQGHRK